MKIVNSTLMRLIAVGIFASVSIISTNAQELKTLGSYQPTIIDSEGAAQCLFQKLSAISFKNNSGCYQRAHFWSFQLSNQDNINSMKVFLFFTARYQREFDYVWMYHVAPLLPVKKADGSIEEMVFDPTFVSKIYDNKPISIRDWTKYFIFPDVECPLVENYQDYLNYQERYYCYIMKTPMFTYLPENLDIEKEVRTSWRSGDLDQMKKALK